MDRAKIIDFQEAKSKLNSVEYRSAAPKTYNQYIKELENSIDYVSKLTLRNIDLHKKCKDIEEFNIISKKIAELKRLYDPILIKIKQSGITESDKEILKSRIRMHKETDSVLEFISMSGEMRRALMDKSRKKEIEKKIIEKKRKAIKVNTRRNVR
ncbi:MAG: hypothetical protein WCX82_00335 [archaeon]